MTHTINNIEFTDEVPKVAGAYWYVRKDAADAQPRATELFLNSNGGLWLSPRTCYVPESNCLFSGRLVPACEIEKAYREGLAMGRSLEQGYEQTGKERSHDAAWLASQARRTVEGGV